MASSSLTEEVLGAKNLLLNLENVVGNFERRLREETERMKQSIDKLTINCELICSNIWQEFDVLMEKARLKTGELCDSMRQKTSEQERKWRLSLQEKENLLEEAGMWHNDLRHLLGAGDADVLCGLQTVKSKLSSRLPDLFAPVKEGHFVVTFPEWCHQSLNQLQEETINLTIGTWPPRNLELQSECYLPCSDTGISMIASSNKDGHILAVDEGDGSIKEYTDSGEVVSLYAFENEEEEFVPFDICHLSKDILVVCGLLQDGGLLFLAQKNSPPFLEKVKMIDTKETSFSALCQMNEQIFACDLNFNKIVCFSKEGKEINSIEIGKSPLSDSYCDRLLCADPTTGNLLAAIRGMSKIFILTENGQILQTVETEEVICDFCADGFGHFYFSTAHGIFSILPKKVLYKYPKETESISRIFVSQKKLFVCFENDGQYLLKIFKIN